MSQAWIPLASLSDQEILDRLATIVATSLRIDRARIAPESTLASLGAESIDIVEITMDVEHAFTVLLPEHSVLQLASLEAGDGVFEREGTLTDEGSALLRARMPEVEPALLAPGTTVAALNDVFLRIDVWVRLIKGLLEATPRICETCGGRLVQGSPARAKCPACAVEVDLPTGDAIGRAWVRRWMSARAS